MIVGKATPIAQRSGDVFIPLVLNFLLSLIIQKIKRAGIKIKLPNKIRKINQLYIENGPNIASLYIVIESIFISIPNNAAATTRTKNDTPKIISRAKTICSK